MSNIPENQHNLHEDQDIALNLQLGTEMDHDDILPPLTIQPPPGFLRFFPPLIKQIASLGGVFKMEQDGALYIEGFYKNGPMKLDFEGDTLVAIDRRNRKTAIANFDDLVQLNFSWWRMSNGSKNQYIVPERPWLDQFIEKKWVRRKVIFEPIESLDGSEG